MHLTLFWLPLYETAVTSCNLLKRHCSSLKLGVAHTQFFISRINFSLVSPRRCRLLSSSLPVPPLQVEQCYKMSWTIDEIPVLLTKARHRLFNYKWSYSQVLFRIGWRLAARLYSASFVPSHWINLQRCLLEVFYYKEERNWVSSPCKKSGLHRIGHTWPIKPNFILKNLSSFQPFDSLTEWDFLSLRSNNLLSERKESLLPLSPVCSRSCPCTSFLSYMVISVSQEASLWLISSHSVRHLVV